MLLLPNLTDEEMKFKYGYYLDEEFTPPKSSFKTISDNNYDNEYYYNSDDWLKDAAGTDDPETMNDVYWNLD